MIKLFLFFTLFFNKNVLGTYLRVLCILSHPVFTMALWNEYEHVPHFANKEWAQEQTTSSSGAGIQTQASWPQRPYSLLICSKLDGYTFLRHSQGNKQGNTRTSGSINWQSVNWIWRPDIWLPLYHPVHHTLHSSYIRILVCGPKAFELVTPHKKKFPEGSSLRLRNEKELFPFRSMKFHWKSVERWMKSLFLDGIWHLSTAHLLATSTV